MGLHKDLEWSPLNTKHNHGIFLWEWKWNLKAPTSLRDPNVSSGYRIDRSILHIVVLQHRSKVDGQDRWEKPHAPNNRSFDSMIACEWSHFALIVGTVGIESNNILQRANEIIFSTRVNKIHSGGLDTTRASFFKSTSPWTITRGEQRGEVCCCCVFVWLEMIFVTVWGLLAAPGR